MAQDKEHFEKGISIAVKYGWGLSNFKRFVSQFLKTKNNEDQWTFDYESYCHHLASLSKENYKWIHPADWATEFYQERWNLKKMKSSFESLKSIIKQ